MHKCTLPVALLAMLAVVCGCGRAGQGTTSIAERPEDTGPEVLPQPTWADASSQAVMAGPLRVYVRGVWVGKAPLGGFGDAGWSEQDCLLVGLRLENISTDRLVHYYGWGRITIGGPDLTDDLGNEYMPENFGLSDLRGQIRAESIRPGTWVDDLLAFQRPVDGIAWLRLELPGDAVRGSEGGPVRFHIPAGMIRRQQ